MQPPFPCPTATWHNDTYEGISPQRPELSASGKSVIITGAGSGIGRETARAFAAAGAAHIALLGRTEATLKETASSISSCPSSVYVVDVTDAKALAAAAAAVGKWQVLVLASGFASKTSTVMESETDNWWQGFETNVKGTVLSIKAFLPTADASHAAVLGITTGVAPMPAGFLPGLSAYTSSKLAQAKIFEFLAAENPNIFAATIHPCMIETETFYTNGGSPDKLPMDKAQLPAHFLVWLASPEGAFLKGRSIWANWDVTELKAQEAQITGGLSLLAGYNGWPYTQPV